MNISDKISEILKVGILNIDEKYSVSTSEKK